MNTAICIDCLENPAVTNDGKLCKKCLKARLEAMTPLRTRKPPSEHLGRSQRPSNVLGGTPH